MGSDLLDQVGRRWRRRRRGSSLTDSKKRDAIVMIKLAYLKTLLIPSFLLFFFSSVIGSFRVGNSERGTWNSLSRGSDGADGLFRDRERESVRQHGPFFSENRSNGFQCCSWAISSSRCCW